MNWSFTFVTSLIKEISLKLSLLRSKLIFYLFQSLKSINWTTLCEEFSRLSFDSVDLWFFWAWKQPTEKFLAQMNCLTFQLSEKNDTFVFFAKHVKRVFLIRTRKFDGRRILDWASLSFSRFCCCYCLSFAPCDRENKNKSKNFFEFCRNLWLWVR